MNEDVFSGHWWAVCQSRPLQSPPPWAVTWRRRTSTSACPRRRRATWTARSCNRCRATWCPARRSGARQRGSKRDSKKSNLAALFKSF